MMTNILLINTNCSWNKGSAAQVISTTVTLQNLIPDSNFTLVSSIPELDSKLCTIHNIKVVGLFSKKPFSKHVKLRKLFILSHYLFRSMLWSAFNNIRLNANAMLEPEILTEYGRADIIVDLSGDTLSDKNALALFSILGIFIGKFLGKKIAVFSQSIGPFKKATRFLSKFCLNAVDLIVIRDEITKNYLIDIGVNNPPTYLAAEIAFLLQPASSSKVREILSKEDLNSNEEKGPLIGIGASALISRTLKLKNNDYVALMAKISDYLVEKLNAYVLFISHVIIPPNYNSRDDRFAAEKIYRLVRNKSSIKIIKGDYSPEELKGIIGQCDLFIGARMHSNIASTSMHVPTVALSWSHKYRGIMRMLGQEDYVCDIRTTTFDELVTKINDAWSNRDEIRNKLVSKTAELEESALYSCKLIKSLIKSIPAK